MPNFGKRSKECRATLHPDLQLICDEVIKIFDYSIYAGLRTDEKQLEYFLAKKSKLDPRDPKKRKYAKHLKQSDGYSHAFDGAPYPIDFTNKSKKRERFYYMAGIFISTAERLYEEGRIEHVLRWGGDWDMDDHFDDQSFDDLPHFELRKPK